MYSVSHVDPFDSRLVAFKNHPDLLLAHRPPPPFLEIVGQLESADGKAFEGEDMIARRREHAADLMVSTLLQGDEGFLFSKDFE